MSRQRRLTVLLLCDDDPREHANTTLDHIAAFSRYSRHRVLRFNPSGVRAARLLRLADYDAVVIHHSLVLTMDEYLPRALRDEIEVYRGFKACFRQDEFQWVDATNAILRELGVDVLFSVAGEQAAALYAPNLYRLEIVPTLTGYVPDDATKRSPVPLAERPIDVGYRGRTLPYWLGRFTREKIEIGARFLEYAKGTRLVCDIAWEEGDRIYGEAWMRFLESSRATLGSESGASIADFDGSVEVAVRSYLARRPEASFDEVHAAVLEPHEGNVVVTAVSPRIFEAAAVRTPLILFPGMYSGVVTPNVHYLPLEKDFSNFDDVVAALGDDAQLDAMKDRAYDDLIASGRYSHEAFVAEFDAVVERGVAHRPMQKRRKGGIDTRHSLALGEHRLRRRAQRVWLRAVGASARVTTVVYLVSEEPAYRRLWRNYVAHPSLFLRAGPRVLLRDLLRLSLARRVRGTGRLVGAFDADRAHVRLAHDASSSAVIEPSPLQTIVWEFGDGDEAVLCVLPRGRTIRVPYRRAEERAYRFAALEAHSRVAPRTVWRALSPFFAADGRHPTT